MSLTKASPMANPDIGGTGLNIILGLEKEKNILNNNIIDYRCHRYLSGNVIR